MLPRRQMMTRLVLWVVLLLQNGGVTHTGSAFLIPPAAVPTRAITTRGRSATPPRSPNNNVNKPLQMRLFPATNDVMTRSEALLQPLLFPAAFAACFRIGAALSVIGQPRMPPNAKFPVGSKIVRLPKLGSRIRLFYPCQQPKEGEGVAATTANDYCTDGRATSDGMAGLVGFRQLGLSFLLAHLADADSGCYKDAVPIAHDDDNNPFPLLVYSHGYGGNMDMATYFLRGMAAQGIVVAAVEHTDGTASSTVLANTERQDFNPSLYTRSGGLTLRAREMLEAVEYLSKEVTPNSEVFLGGHSYGAPSAILAAQRVTTNIAPIAGLILHDPALGMGYSLLQLPPKLPTISYTSDEYNAGGVRCGDVTYHVRGAFHGNFVDAPLWAPLWVMRTLSLVIPACGPADPNVVHQQLAESAKAFTINPKSRADVEKNLFERVLYDNDDLDLSATLPRPQKSDGTII